MCRRLQLTRKLERRVQDDVRLGLISPATARELIRLPRGDQVGVADAVTRHDLTSRQTHRLVDALLGADVAGRRVILASPLDCASPAGGWREAGRGVRVSEGGNRVVQQLLRLQAAANRLDELLLERAPGERDLAVLRELVPQLLARADVAIARMRRLVGPEATTDEVRHAS